MWLYSQSTGDLWCDTGHKVAVGYSGFGEGKNNPLLESKRNVGPIPRGLWVIGNAYDSHHLGKLAIPLYESGHDALKRTYFRIHGDSAKRPGQASKGCIVMPRNIRVRIIASNDRILKVIE